MYHTMSALCESFAEITTYSHTHPEEYNLQREITFDANMNIITKLYYINAAGEQIFIDSPYVDRSSFDKLVGVCLFVPRDVIDWSFLEEPQYAYWLFVFDYIEYKPLKEVYLHMIYTAHLKGDLETFNLLNLSEERFEAAYQSLLAQTVSTLDFEFLYLPQCTEWATAFATLEGQTYASLFKIILCKAYQTQMIRFINPDCIAEGTLDREYKKAIYMHLQWCLKMPYLFALHNITSIYDFRIINIDDARCDERCFQKDTCNIVRKPAFYMVPHIDHPEYETVTEYYRTCHHDARNVSL